MDGTRRRFTSTLRAHLPWMAVLLCVAGAPFLLTILRGETPFFLDIADHWYPHRLAAWEARQHGELAHWCRYMFSGFPLLAQGEASLSYPPHFLLDLFHPSRTILVHVIGHRFLLGALVYAAVVVRGGSRPAATLAGSLMVLSGITNTCFTQIAVLRTLAWLPLLLLASHALGRGRLLSGALWTAGAVWMGVVAGYPPFLQRASLAMLPLILLEGGLPRSAADWAMRGKAAAAAGGGALLGAALGASQLLPTMALAAGSQRQLGLDPALLDGLRAEPRDLLLLLVPRVDLDNGVVKQGFAYVGVLPIMLGLLAVVRRRPGAVAFAAVALLGLVASLGAQTPLGAALASMPMISSFRNPSQYLLLWVLAMPMLAAAGFDAWRERRPTARDVAVCFGVPIVLVAMATFVPSLPTAEAGVLRAVIPAVVLGVGAALTISARTRAATVIVAALAAFDAGSLGFGYPSKAGRTRPVDSLLVPDAPFARVADHHRRAGHAEPARIITSNLGFNWDGHGVVAGLENVRGLVSLIPMRSLDLARIADEGSTFPRRPPDQPLYDYGPLRAMATPAIDLFAVRYAVGWKESPGPEWARVGDTEWERDAVAPLRVVGTPVFVPSGPDSEPVVRALRDPAFDPRNMAVICDPDAPSQGRTDGRAEAAVLEAVYDRPNEVAALVRSSGTAYVLLAATSDPGWSCVDGDGAVRPILAANYAHMAVRVDAGTTRLTWRYESPGWRTGKRISIAAVCITLALLLGLARRR